METARTEARELTRHETGGDPQAGGGMCANYDPEYGCLPLDYGGMLYAGYVLDGRLLQIFL
jgi:hypothetical protein